MGSLVGVYLDADGTVAQIVIPEKDNFAAHDGDPALTRITVPIAAYQAAVPAVNNSGMPFYEDLCGKIIADIQAAGFMKSGLKAVRDAHAVAAVADAKVRDLAGQLADAQAAKDVALAASLQTSLTTAQTDLTAAKTAQATLGKAAPGITDLAKP